MQMAPVHRTMDWNRVGMGNTYRDGLVIGMLIQLLNVPLTSL